MPNSNSPRSRKARTDSAADHRRRIIASGGRALSLLISAEATEALGELTGLGLTITQAVEQALIAAAKERRQS